MQALWQSGGPPPVFVANPQPGVPRSSSFNATPRAHHTGRWCRDLRSTRGLLPKGGSEDWTGIALRHHIFRPGVYPNVPPRASEISLGPAENPSDERLVQMYNDTCNKWSVSSRRFFGKKASLANAMMMACTGDKTGSPHERRGTICLRWRQVRVLLYLLLPLHHAATGAGPIAMHATFGVADGLSFFLFFGRSSDRHPG